MNQARCPYRHDSCNRRGRRCSCCCCCYSCCCCCRAGSSLSNGHARQRLRMQYHSSTAHVSNTTRRTEPDQCIPVPVVQSAVHCPFPAAPHELPVGTNVRRLTENKAKTKRQHIQFDLRSAKHTDFPKRNPRLKCTFSAVSCTSRCSRTVYNSISGTRTS